MEPMAVQSMVFCSLLRPPPAASPVGLFAHCPPPLNRCETQPEEDSSGQNSFQNKLGSFPRDTSILHPYKNNAALASYAFVYT